MFSLGFTGFYWILLRITGFYLGFLALNGFSLGLLGFVKCPWLGQGLLGVVHFWNEVPVASSASSAARLSITDRSGCVPFDRFIFNSFFF